MEREDLRTISEVAFFLDQIHRYISTLESKEELFIISDLGLHTSLITQEVIKIPDCLLSEFKQKLIDYYREKYNEYVKKLKAIEL